MIRINLLPFRAARKKENVRRQISIFLLSLILVGAAVIYYNIFLSGKIKDLNASIKETKVQVAKYNKINAEIKEIKKNLELLNRKIEVIETLETNRREPLALLASLTDLIMAERMWFTRLSSKGPKINIEGIALDNQTVSDFMTRLERSALYGDVNLGTVKQKELKTMELTLKSFDVNARKVAPKPDKPKEEAAQAKPTPKKS
jgi:type IV pilus assembly protein PilN